MDNEVIQVCAAGRRPSSVISAAVEASGTAPLPGFVLPLFGVAAVEVVIGRVSAAFLAVLVSMAAAVVFMSRSRAQILGDDVPLSDALPPSDDGGLDRPEVVTIELLGTVRPRDANWALTPQQMAFVTFLACVGEATRESIIEALWDGRPVSKSRFPNLLAEVRAKIGRHRIPDSVDRRYRLVGITTDVARLERAVAALEAGYDGADHQLAATLDLVRGVPLTVPATRHWAWVNTRTDLVNRAEVLVTSASLKLCRRYRELGDLDAARRICERGLAAAPLDEDLTRALVDVLLQQGKPSLAHRVVADWEARVRGLGCGEPTPELRQRLVGSTIERRSRR